jgi:hypothetical protein
MTEGRVLGRWCAWWWCAVDAAAAVEARGKCHASPVVVAGHRGEVFRLLASVRVLPSKTRSTSKIRALWRLARRINSSRAHMLLLIAISGVKLSRHELVKPVGKASLGRLRHF